MTILLVVLTLAAIAVTTIVVHLGRNASLFVAGLLIGLGAGFQIAAVVILSFAT